jgi:hypothetical protein
MKNLFQRIFLSSEPDNEVLKELVYEYFYLPWLKGDFLPEFAPEYTGSYLIALQKPSGGIRGITPVDIWRWATGNVIVQATQKRVTKTCMETYSNFKQLTLSKDGASHFLYFLNVAYADPAFTSAEDVISGSRTARNRARELPEIERANSRNRTRELPEIERANSRNRARELPK